MQNSHLIEEMKYDVVIVGAGISGLSTAFHLKQLSLTKGEDISICILEKSTDIGSHILSGAILDSKGLDELVPGWQDEFSEIRQKVLREDIVWLKDSGSSISLPSFLTDVITNNVEKEFIQLGDLCRWLAKKAEELEVDIIPGCPVSELLYIDGEVVGVKAYEFQENNVSDESALTQQPYYHFLAKHTVLAEGSAGALGRNVISKYSLTSHEQTYAIGIKERWHVPGSKLNIGTAIHGFGWPFDSINSGGFFIYAEENEYISIGSVIDLDFSTKDFSPYEAFQTLKQHSYISQILQQGTRVEYGARSITKGGLNSLPCSVFPGGFLVGCDAGTLNTFSMKGIHTAIKHGMIIAECIVESYSNVVNRDDIGALYRKLYANSWLGKELTKSKGHANACKGYGKPLGHLLQVVKNLTHIDLPVYALRSKNSRLESRAQRFEFIPDNIVSFNKDASFVLTHNQSRPAPNHLDLKNIECDYLLAKKLSDLCPVGVYEWENNRLNINHLSCVHCQSCAIKYDVRWQPICGGPAYVKM